MTTFYGIKNFGEGLRNSSHKMLCLADLTNMIRQKFNVHTSKTVKHYLQVLEDQGYLKRVVIDGCPRFAIQRIVDGKYVIESEVKRND